MVGLFPGALLILACKALKLPSGSAANTSSELGASKTSSLLPACTVSISLDKSKTLSFTPVSLISAAAIA